MIAGYSALGAACTLLAVVTFLSLVAPVDVIREQIVRDFKAQTGRDLVIAGPVSLSFFPRVGAVLRDVSLSGPPRMPGTPLMRAHSIRADVRGMALLSGKVSVQRLVLNRPVFNLRVDAQGRRNWDFAGLAFERTRLAQAGANDGPRPTRQRAAQIERMMADLAVSLPTDVRVSEGSARYSDERAGVTQDVKAIDLELAFGELGGALDVSGSFNWRGETVAIEASIATVAALVEERPVRVTLKTTGPSLTLGYKGTARGTATGVALDGSYTLNAASMAALAAWAGGAPLNGDVGALAVNGRITSDGTRVSLSDLTANVGGTQAKGALTLDTAAAKPYLNGTLQVADLDLTKVLLREGAPASAPPRRQGQRQGEVAPQPRSGPQVRGFTKNEGKHDWSDDAIDTALLAMADADLKLQADRIVYRDFKTGVGRVSVALKDRVMRLTLEEMQLYGGSGRGVVTIDSSGDTPATDVNLTLDRVSAGPLLKDALGFDWFDGRSGIAVALAGRGLTERQMVASLKGTVDLKTTNGSIVGFDLPKFVRNLEQGRFLALEIAPTDRTPFSEMAGTFTLTNGIARNQDLRVITQNVRLTGSGAIDLPRQEIDYTLNTKLSGSGTQGQGTVLSFSNIEIPLRVEGPWEKPNISIKGQEQLSETLKQLGKNLKSQDVQDVLKGLLRGDGEGRTKPREFLEKLFKKE
jgi:AsmA protein